MPGTRSETGTASRQRWRRERRAGGHRKSGPSNNRKWGGPRHRRAGRGVRKEPLSGWGAHGPRKADPASARLSVRMNLQLWDDSEASLTAYRPGPAFPRVPTTVPRPGCSPGSRTPPPDISAELAPFSPGSQGHHAIPLLHNRERAAGRHGL